MKRINLNELAKDITLAEGLKKSLSIGQVKEVQRLVIRAMGVYWYAGNESGVIEAIKKAANRK